MAGLDPAIHVSFLAEGDEDVDARHKAGHDDLKGCRFAALGQSG